MITSTKNPTIVELRKLSQRKHRQRQNRFVVEGLQLLTLALAAAGRHPAKVIPRQLFYNEALFTGETAPRLLTQLGQAGAEVVAVAPKVLDSLSDRDTSQGLIATFALREMEWSLAELEALLQPERPARPKLVLILDKLQDPGNLGTLIRTADAVGAQAVCLLEPGVDPFDPKTVRGTMGSIFAVPLLRVSHFAGLAAQLSRLGYRLVGADGQRGLPPWHSQLLLGPTGLVLGNEARGLSPEVASGLSDFVGLPLRGQAESLNVAVAGGVLMYEWLRLNDQP